MFSHSREYDAFVLKARCASFVLLFIFFGGFLPIVVADFISKKRDRRERRFLMTSLLQLIDRV